MGNTEIPISGVGWNTKASIGSGGIWDSYIPNVVWLSYTWIKLQYGGIHQSRKNECVLLVKVTTLVLVILGNVYFYLHSEASLWKLQVKMPCKIMDRNTKTHKLCSVLYF